MVRGRVNNPRIEGDVNIDGIVAKLKKKFEEDIVEAFIRCKRYDLLAGYIESEGMQQASNDVVIRKKLVFLPDGTVAIKNENSEHSLFNEEKRNNGSRNRYVKPNPNWKSECREFVTNEYFAELLKLQEDVLKRGSGWDAIAFASRVPFAISTAFEDKVISLNDSLLILAFANDVEGADIDKLRTSIENIDPDKAGVDPYELRDHIAEFHCRHGFGQTENVSENSHAQPEA